MTQYRFTTVAAGTGVSGVSTADTFGMGNMYNTVIDVNTTLPAIAGGANLAVGKKVFSFPASADLEITGSHISLAIDETEGNITADTPDLGLGTTIASGAVAVLSGTAAFENIMTGQTMDDCDGTAEVARVNTSLMIAPTDSHDVYINVADGWAASGDAAAVLSGRVVLFWRQFA